jgi:NitT/TauT family transport system ATP-binding protein
VTRRRMNFELERIWMQRRPTTVMVTHSVDEAVLLADRVLVLTERPARVRMDTSVPFARPRSAALMRTAEFHRLADELTAQLEPA